MDIDEIFQQLLLGNSSVITSDVIKMINTTALELYNVPKLNKDQLEKLKTIILICNVLYNRTDMTILPVEDGFYDLLLEKYKTYDEHFQVGSAVVEFRNFIENDIVLSKKIAKPVFMELKEIERDSTHQSIYDEIIRKGKPILNIDDFRPNPPLSQQAPITKRTHNTQHNHPTLVGTLDKAKFVLNQDAINAGVFSDQNVKVLERDFFQRHIADGIIHSNDEIEVIVELKYDGISVEADCTNEVISARTRGDTGIGEASDITPILEHYLFKHADCMIGEEPIGVKFEAIMTKSNLAVFNRLRDRSYVNCRSAIVGLFGAGDAYLYRDLITLVPLAVDRDDIPSIENRMQEVEFLNKVFSSHGEPLRYCYFKGTVTEVLYLIKAFQDEAKIARDYLNFMYDGIVVSYVDENIRYKLGRKNFINKYSMAVKFQAEEKQTIFRGYTFEVGQHGNITPMLHYDPVEFMGTIHTKSSGSSYQRFNELELRYGDIINVEYRNDVMPYVSKLDCEANRKNTNPKAGFIANCPVCGQPLVISNSGKSVLCVNQECPGRGIQRMTNMFSKLNIKGFAEATFKALNVHHFYELANISKDQLIITLGQADGTNFYYEFSKLLVEPQIDYNIMGALGFTGLARKKWKNILNVITIKELYNVYSYCKNNRKAFEAELNKRGIKGAILDTIVNEFNFFAKDIKFIIDHMNIVDTFGTSQGAEFSIKFSGFRNQQLEEQLNNLDGIYADQDGGVNKNDKILLVPYKGFESGKVLKARKFGIRIMSVDEFIDNSEQILGTKITK